jgi:glycerate 2-kinase
MTPVRIVSRSGATPEQVRQLRARLVRLTEHYGDRFGRDVAGIEGAGAAGKLGGGLAVLGARLVPGFDLIAEQMWLDDALRTADAVVTGEGKLDPESFNGKVVGGVLALAARSGLPTLVVAGTVDDAVAGRATSVSLIQEFGLDAAWGDPLGCVQRATAARLEKEMTP